MAREAKRPDPVAVHRPGGKRLSAVQCSDSSVVIQVMWPSVDEWSLYCRWNRELARLKCLLSRWFDMKHNTTVTPLSVPALSCLFASRMNSGFI